jgi:hypothetical protein
MSGVDAAREQALWRCQNGFFPGPAKYQMIKPINGRKNTTRTQINFCIPFAELCKIIKIA